MNAIFKTDKGKIRPHNEDNGGIFLNSAHHYLAIIADGMGGHNAGEVASRLAVSSLEKLWEETDDFASPEMAEQWIRTQIESVNKKIFDHAQTHPECEGMGTTLVAALWLGGFATIVNIGDSRCYLLNEDGFKQVTEDHSLVNELVKAGEISAEDAEFHPRKNMLLKAMGTEPETEMDIFTITMEKNDKLLLCSDGLSNKVSLTEMQAIIETEMELEEKATTLIDLANQYGGEDNISIAIIEAQAESRCDD
ncbi:Stp1/IreP family PP2C-type Ser/Thr phosphatase [Lederbergia sp. NSJ-179]|uniref:Stp1/IreP family PP2C-type Ser/Thr phosphatase n=1 Tax=Lederbergia sp. NSJ-179 TaxID=2931402 RepID=UPI001FD60E4E|nr:Stp1/IreP family PP2C-type Ser/Thr phosphatase [Lederbergia sp. NSJ-179]MCJ7839595.1 Stp1/IreP family PP2C-type Ser/Thr phosphatase [Lederbergia sp. NSJ-179]